MAGFEHTSDMYLSNEDQKAWDMALIVQPPTWAHIMNEEKENGGLKQMRVFNTAIFNCFTSEALYFLHGLENWCEGLAVHLSEERKGKRNNENV